ncbi:MAG: type II toxin-antitoxin system death-on-curing family toxin [Polyangiales bacterium]
MSGARRIVFLTLDEVLMIHTRQLARHGGAGGLRDLGALSSAIAMPRATFGGRELHATLDEKAGAYLFHVSQAHAFVDGNKRVALASALVFLWLNERAVRATEDEVVDLTLGVASGKVTKAEVAVFFLRQHCPEVSVTPSPSSSPAPRLRALRPRRGARPSC